MCGIFGQIGAPLAPERREKIRALLAHRGPDDHGFWESPTATLLHTRLKVIDLSEDARQPMSNEDQSVWATFNGEIYNFQELREALLGAGHRFRSRSDTEVLVHGYEEWGDLMVERLEGMFAFGLWDERRRRLLLARDRAGKKPLFYTEHQGSFLFASEIKALLAAGVPAEPDPVGIGAFLTYGYAPPPGTFYQGIKQLPPASLLVLAPERPPAIKKFWDISFSQREAPVREEEAAAQVRSLLGEAVRKRLIADVPLGAFLSGGLDSSIVVGLMAQHQRPRTFSIGFAKDPRYDETAHARLVSRHFDTEHHEFFVGPESFSLVERLVWLHDGPFGDSSAIPTYLVSQHTRSHVTVALSGDGGDELFAGYLRFFAAAFAERIPSSLRRLGGRFASLLPPNLPERSLPGRIRRFLCAAERPLGDRLAAWSPSFAFQLDSILRPEIHARIEEENILSFHRRFFTPDASPLSQALTHNFHTYLPYDLLIKTDRTSMAHGLEVRSPFLDTRLTEYVAGLPDAYKIRGRTLKYILRRAFSDFLPPAILTRGKMGFGVPLAAWFRQDLRAYLRERLLSPRARLCQYLRPEAVARLVKDHTSGRADYAHQLWMLLTLEIWLERLRDLEQLW